MYWGCVGRIELMTPCSMGITDVGTSKCDTITVGFSWHWIEMGTEISNSAGFFMEDFSSPKFSSKNSVLSVKLEWGLSADSPLHSFQDSQRQLRAILPLFILFKMIFYHPLFPSYKDLIWKFGEIWEAGEWVNQFQSPLAVSLHPSLERKKSLKIIPNLPLKWLVGQWKIVQTDLF